MNIVVFFFFFKKPFLDLSVEVPVKVLKLSASV